MKSAKDRIEELAAEAKRLSSGHDECRFHLFGKAFHELRIEIESAMNSAKALLDNCQHFTKHLDDYEESLVRGALKDTETMLLLASRVHVLRLYKQASE